MKTKRDLVNLVLLNRYFVWSLLVVYILSWVLIVNCPQPETLWNQIKNMEGYDVHPFNAKISSLLYNVQVSTFAMESLEGYIVIINLNTFGRVLYWLQAISFAYLSIFLLTSTFNFHDDMNITQNSIILSSFLFRFLPRFIYGIKYIFLDPPIGSMEFYYVKFIYLPIGGTFFSAYYLFLILLSTLILISVVLIFLRHKRNIKLRKEEKLFVNKQKKKTSKILLIITMVLLSILFASLNNTVIKEMSSILPWYVFLIYNYDKIVNLIIG